ncbi:hypothetical protein [Thalassobius sp. MITS945101]|uniref:hypothetical protein n=1 Tax=Thalassobius sp. MITS945101 TaxID=3096994 RepID=UPI00399B3811
MVSTNKAEPRHLNRWIPTTSGHVNALSPAQTTIETRRSEIAGAHPKLSNKQTQFLHDKALSIVLSAQPNALSNTKVADTAETDLLTALNTENPDATKATPHSVLDVLAKTRKVQRPRPADTGSAAIFASTSKHIPIAVIVRLCGHGDGTGRSCARLATVNAAPAE